MSVKKTISKLAKKPIVPVHDDPILELRRLISDHKSLTKRKVAVEHMCSDRVNRETGETIVCRLPIEQQQEGLDFAAKLDAAAEKLKTPILKQLRKFPVYNQWLKNVHGVGPIVAGYLIAECNFELATKPSQLNRFCGVACIDGMSERPAKGQKNKYNAEMKTRLFQAFMSMRMTSGTGTSKYLRRWEEAKQGILTAREQNAKGQLVRSDGKLVAAKKFADDTGRRKAQELFLLDFYTVSRAAMGLPIWCSYVAMKRGVEHGGDLLANHFVTMTLEEAVEKVGWPGKVERATNVAAE